jgi:hypothetical protein
MIYNDTAFSFVILNSKLAAMTFLYIIEEETLALTFVKDLPSLGRE